MQTDITYEFIGGPRDGQVVPKDDKNNVPLFKFDRRTGWWLGTKEGRMIVLASVLDHPIHPNTTVDDPSCYAKVSDKIVDGRRIVSYKWFTVESPHASE